MSVVCYFIGGPLDLTKSVRAHAERRLFSPAKVAWDARASDSRETIGPVPVDHVYRMLPSLPLSMSAWVSDNEVAIYVYEGQGTTR